MRHCVECGRELDDDEDDICSHCLEREDDVDYCIVCGSILDDEDDDDICERCMENL